MLWYLYSQWIKLNGYIDKDKWEKGEDKRILINTANQNMLCEGPKLQQILSFILLGVVLSVLAAAKRKNSNVQKSVNICFNNIWEAMENGYEMKSTVRPS